MERILGCSAGLGDYKLSENNDRSKISFRLTLSTPLTIMDLLESLKLKENGTWLAAGLLIVSAVAMKVSSRGKLPTPPGPLGLPIVGNIFQMPSEEPWKVYAEWAKQYGMSIL